MKLTSILVSIILTAACGSSLHSQASSGGTADKTTHSDMPVVATPGMSATLVKYGERDIVRLKAKLRYTTLIVLPKSEQILDFTCGDKEYWIVNGSQNFAYVKPAKANSQTNLNLITASGNVYSFVLNEVSGAGDPDLKVFVEPKDDSMISAMGAAP